MKQYKVAILGFDHIHGIQFYNCFSAHPDQYELMGCADVPWTHGVCPESSEVRMNRNVTGGRGSIRVFEDHRTLLDQKPDIVAICTPIGEYADVAVECLSRGIAVILEKPMAVNLEEALKMYRASVEHKTPLFVKWPIVWCRAFDKVHDLIREGAVGEVFRIEYRSPATLGPHSGRYTSEERAKMWWYHRDLGGGSVMDYAGYGHALLTHLYGAPAKRNVAFRKNFMVKFSDVEDYSSFMLDFGDCVGIVEGSWSTINSGEIPTGPVVYGSKGTIVADRFSSTVKVYNTFSHKFTEPDAVYETEPDDTPDIAADLYTHFTEGKPLNEMLLPEFNLTVMAALDAGIRSMSSERVEPVCDPFTLV